MSVVVDEMGNVIYDGGEFNENQPVDTTPGWLTPDFYRQKLSEFQALLDSLVGIEADLQQAGYYAYASGDYQQIAEYDQLANEFDSKRAELRSVATALNMATGTINAVGGNFPAVQMPFGMALPVVPLVAGVAAITLAVSLISWGRAFFKLVGDYARRYQHISAIAELPENERASALEALRKMEINAMEAEAKIDSSPLSAVTEMAKWAAVAGVGYMIYKALKGNHGN